MPLKSNLLLCFLYARLCTCSISWTVGHTQIKTLRQDCPSAVPLYLFIPMSSPCMESRAHDQHHNEWHACRAWDWNWSKQVWIIRLHSPVCFPYPVVSKQTQWRWRIPKNKSYTSKYVQALKYKIFKPNNQLGQSPDKRVLSCLVIK